MQEYLYSASVNHQAKTSGLYCSLPPPRGGKLESAETVLEGMELMEWIGKREMKRLPQSLVEGAVAGTIATVPMSIAMLAMYRMLPRRERYPLPPHLITEEVAERADQDELADSEAGIAIATGISHFGYGVAAAALYPLTFDRLPLPAALKGMLFGVVVWAASYLGWLPALDILPPATEQPPRRTLLMIVAHFIYGAVTGMAFETLRGERIETAQPFLTGSWLRQLHG